MYTFRNVHFTDADGAKDALTRLTRRRIVYGFATVKDLYEITGTPTNDPEADNYGWYDVNVNIVTDFLGGFRIDLPIPERVDNVRGAEVNQPEAVNHPNHYQSETGMEVIDVIEAFTFDLKGIEAFDVGSVLKYICRWKKKNGLEDLQKAKWFLEHLIKHVEKMEKEND